MINENCGALFPRKLQNTVQAEGCNFGFAFDGDGDRVVGVSSKGEIFDGDSIIYALAKEKKQKGLLSGNAVVATKMSSFALEEKLKEEGIGIFYSEVGDSNVLEEMRERNLSLGGEKSGHILFEKGLGDGIKTAIALSRLIINGFNTDSCLLPCYPRFEKNLPLHSDKAPTSEQIDKVKILLKDSGKIIVRPSGTEPLIRVMLESREKSLLDKALEILGIS